MRGSHEEEELGDELARQCKGSAIMPAIYIASRPESAAVISASAVIPMYTPRVGVCCVPGFLFVPVLDGSAFSPRKLKERWTRKLYEEYVSEGNVRERLRAKS